MRFERVLIFALRCYNNRLLCLLLYSPEWRAVSCQCRRFNACKSAARDDLASSLNYDRRFRFSKQRAIQLLIALENL